MPVVFNLNITVDTDKWTDDNQKQDFIDNFTDVINMGLFKMTVPDWTISDVTVQYKD